MEGYEIKFNVYANSQDEANNAALAIKQFISEKATIGIAVTADKISEAINRFKYNRIVTNYFK